MNKDLKVCKMKTSRGLVFTCVDILNLKIMIALIYFYPNKNETMVLERQVKGMDGHLTMPA